MAKSIIYTESKQIKEIAEQLKARYYNVVGYIDIEKVFFAFKGGDLPENFQYEVLGLQNEWVKHTHENQSESKLYCLAMTYDFFQNSQGSLLEWTILDLMYSCHENMNGKMRRKDVHEFSRILKTLDDLGSCIDWRKNTHLPPLLCVETVVFGIENESL